MSESLLWVLWGAGGAVNPEPTLKKGLPKITPNFLFLGHNLEFTVFY